MSRRNLIVPVVTLIGPSSCILAGPQAPVDGRLLIHTMSPARRFRSARGAG